jgi:hypothetical protein
MVRGALASALSDAYNRYALLNNKNPIKKLQGSYKPKQPKQQHQA